MLSYNDFVYDELFIDVDVVKQVWNTIATSSSTIFFSKNVGCSCDAFDLLIFCFSTFVDKHCDIRFVKHHIGYNDFCHYISVYMGVLDDDRNVEFFCPNETWEYFLLTISYFINILEVL